MAVMLMLCRKGNQAALTSMELTGASLSWRVHVAPVGCGVVAVVAHLAPVGLLQMAAMHEGSCVPWHPVPFPGPGNAQLTLQVVVLCQSLATPSQVADPAGSTNILEKRHIRAHSPPMHDLHLMQVYVGQQALPNAQGDLMSSGAHFNRG